MQARKMVHRIVNMHIYPSQPAIDNTHYRFTTDFSKISTQYSYITLYQLLI